MQVDASLLREIETIAREAGAAVLEIYARDFAVQEKADKSPLTEADLAVHTIIARRLSELSTSLPLLSEEDMQGFAGPDQAIGLLIHWMAPRNSSNVTVGLL